MKPSWGVIQVGGEQEGCDGAQEEVRPPTPRFHGALPSSAILGFVGRSSEGQQSD